MLGGGRGRLQVEGAPGELSHLCVFPVSGDVSERPQRTALVTACLAGWSELKEGLRQVRLQTTDEAAAAAGASSALQAHMSP